MDLAEMLMKHEDELPYVMEALQKHELLIVRDGVIYAAAQVRESFVDDGVAKTRLVSWNVHELGSDTLHNVDTAYKMCSCGADCPERRALRYGSN